MTNERPQVPTGSSTARATVKELARLFLPDSWYETAGKRWNALRKEKYPYHKTLIVSGHPLKFEIKTEQDRYLFDNFHTEYEVLKGLSKHIHPGDKVWDIGAGIGMHIAALSAMTKGTTFAGFEPLTRNFESLKINLLANDIRAPLYQTAVFNHQGKVPLTHTESHSAFTVYPRQSDYDQEVNCTTIDILSDQFQAPSVLIIDVEGAEREVLAGMRNARPRIVCIQVHNEMGITNEEVGAILNDKGYEELTTIQQNGQSHLIYQYPQVLQ